MRYLIEPSSRVAIIHDAGRSSAKLYWREDTFTVNDVHAEALSDCCDDVKWCDECFADGDSGPMDERP